MDEDLRRRLRARRPAIRREWEALLRAEPVATPLGHPDALAHLMDRTLKVVFASLGASGRRHRAGPPFSIEDIRAECPCGRNPLLAYFLAGERALRGALLLVLAEAPGPAPEAWKGAVSELCLVMHDIARRDVVLFCSLCQHRQAGLQGAPAAPCPRAAIAVRARAPRASRRGASRARRARKGSLLLRRPFQAGALFQPSAWRLT